jgi:hypothetical protein
MSTKSAVGAERSKLVFEVRQLIDARLKNGLTVGTALVVSALVENHRKNCPGIDQWFVTRAYEAVRNIVRETVRELDDCANETGDGGNPNLRLPGFERLQSWYSIERDGESQIVPVDQLTPDEGAAKVAQLRKFGQGALLHADELERYLAQRFEN